MSETRTVSEGLEVARRGAVAEVRFERPERLNALTDGMMDALPDVLRELAEDRSVRCVVLTGAGGAFCAGGDLSTVEGARKLERDALRARFRGRFEAARLLHDMRKPTLAVIRGVAAGAGLSLALACDLRVGGDDLRLTTAFAKVGFPGDYGVSHFLTRLVGPSRALELLYLSDVVDAERAFRLGLVNRVVEAGALEETARAWADRLAEGPPLALAAMKRHVGRAAAGDLGASLDAEADATVETFRTEDLTEGLAAFGEKRRPRFEGR